MAPRGRSHAVAAAAGAVLTVAVAMFCMYAEAFSWAVNRGTLLDFTLIPVGYVAPTFSWTFILAEGLVCAACATWLVRDSIVGYRRARIAGAAAAAATIVLIAVVSQIASPPGWSLAALPLWQRGGHFIATSSAFVFFAGFLLIWLLSKNTVVSAHAVDTATPIRADDGRGE